MRTCVCKMSDSCNNYSGINVDMQWCVSYVILLLQQCIPLTYNQRLALCIIMVYLYYTTQLKNCECIH